MSTLRNKTGKKEEQHMRKMTRGLIAFALNFWPGLGFYFSGSMHNLMRLRLLGLGLASAFLFILPISAVIMHPTPLTNHNFTASELLLPIAIAFTFGILGASVEYAITGEGVKS